MEIAGHSKRIIDIYVIADVDFIIRNPPESEKGTEAPVSSSQAWGYTIVTGAGRATHQGVQDIAFHARAGETVRFFATSGSDNFEQCVFIHDIRQGDGEQVLEGFESVAEERVSIAPGSKESVLPAQSVPRPFWFYECKTARGGSGSYRLELALYTRDEEGQPRFAGLYPWDLRITLKKK